MEESGRNSFWILTVVTPRWWDLIVYNDHALPLLSAPKFYIWKREEKRKANVTLGCINRGRSFETREVIIWILTTWSIMSGTQGSVAHVKRKVDKLQVGQRLLEIRVSWRNRRKAGSGPAWWLSVCGLDGKGRTVEPHVTLEVWARTGGRSCTVEKEVPTILRWVPLPANISSHADVSVKRKWRTSSQGTGGQW